MRSIRVTWLSVRAWALGVFAKSSSISIIFRVDFIRSLDGQPRLYTCTYQFKFRSIFLGAMVEVMLPFSVEHYNSQSSSVSQPSSIHNSFRMQQRRENRLLVSHNHLYSYNTNSSSSSIFIISSWPVSARIEAWIDFASRGQAKRNNLSVNVNSIDSEVAD